jgi:hypothetical protein
MLSWLKKAFNVGKMVLGRVKSGVETGARLFNKGKEIYSGVKGFASNLPFVGSVAGEMIKKAEGQANEYAKQRLGVDFKDVNKAVSTAEGVAKFLPSSR